MTEPPDILDAIHENTKQALWYARSRFLATWLVIALLALLTGITLFAAGRNARTDIAQTEEIARVSQETANSAAASTDEITAFLKGEQGIPGVPGANGQDGAPGQPGSAGFPGKDGAPGPSGSAGPTGEPGPAGPAGATGTGITGPQGPSGTPGPKGDAGANGQNGTKGANGDQGQQGGKGEKGDHGEKGEPGPQGIPGPVGPAGPAGPQGPPTVFITVFATGPVSTASPKSTNAFCPSGDRIVGGGFSLDPPTGVRVTVSLPLGNEVWNVQAEQDGQASAWSLTAWAICATSSPTT